MKNAIILSLISILLLTSCADDDLYVGEGEIITKELTLNDFNAINAIGSYDIIISKGATQKVEVTGHSNIIERLETHVYNNIWGIELRDGNYRNSYLTIHIYLVYELLLIYIRLQIDFATLQKQKYVHPYLPEIFF